jgi:hypothetical protein
MSSADYKGMEGRCMIVLRTLVVTLLEYKLINITLNLYT